jgi:hypothetical protein
LLLLLLLFAAPAAAEETCTLDPADRAWLEGALANWRRAAVDDLQLPDAPLPMVYVIDSQCTHRLPGGDFAAMTSEAHGGKVRLPGGEQVPLGPISFAFDRDQFVMSLPGVWRAAGVTSELGLEKLMDGVLLHEIMHTRQSGLASDLLAEPAARAGVSDDELNDDIVQQRFADDPDYAAAWSAERDLLFAAAAAPDGEAAQRLAQEALEAMRARRARWFTGDKAAFAELDDVFLTMEGMGQWLIYRYFISPEGGSVPHEQALAAVRRGGRWWSQDEGLALVLTVDRLLPGWQQRAFRDPDWRAERLLAAASGQFGPGAPSSIGSPNAGSELSSDQRDPSLP